MPDKCGRCVQDSLENFISSFITGPVVLRLFAGTCSLLIRPTSAHIWQRSSIDQTVSICEYDCGEKNAEGRKFLFTIFLTLAACLIIWGGFYTECGFAAQKVCGIVVKSNRRFYEILNMKVREIEDTQVCGIRGSSQHGSELDQCSSVSSLPEVLAVSSRSD